MPAVDGIYETVLYAGDVPAMVAFYTDVVGLKPIDPPDDNSAAFRLADGNVLLIFDPARTGDGGRFVPPHGTSGPGHLAFRVPDLDEHARALSDRGVGIEREITWSESGRSIYFRDPAGNSVEFVEGEIW